VGFTFNFESLPPTGCLPLGFLEKAGCSYGLVHYRKTSRPERLAFSHLPTAEIIEANVLAARDMISKYDIDI